MNAIDIFQELPDGSKAIFRSIQLGGPTTKTELLGLPKMTLTTLNRLMRPLEELGLIVDTGFDASSGGRPPRLFDADKNLYRLIGVDISRTYTQVVVTNLKLEVLSKDQFPMDKSCTPEATVKRIAAIVEEALSRTETGRDALLGFGVGTVGPLDTKRGLMLRPKGFTAPGWHEVSIKSMLEHAVGMQAAVENGANCGAAAEHLFGRGAGKDNLAYFNCGVGIRTGAISSGHIVAAINGEEDSFAHMIVDFEGELCACGNVGCIECYAGINAISKRYAEARSLKHAPHYLDVCSAAERGDAAALKIITRAAAVFGTGLANYVRILNPELVILSGPLIAGSPSFYRMAVETAQNKTAKKRSRLVEFDKGGHFADAAMAAGAASAAFAKLL